MAVKPPFDSFVSHPCARAPDLGVAIDASECEPVEPAQTCKVRCAQGYYVAPPPNLAYAPGSPAGTAALGSPVAPTLAALGGSPVQQEPPTKKPKTEHV